MQPKKGISPLIATILLIGFVVALSGVITIWGSSFIKELTESSKKEAEVNLLCSKVDLNIKDACVFGQYGRILAEGMTGESVGLVLRLMGNNQQEVKSVEGLKIGEFKKYVVQFNPFVLKLPDKVQIIPIVDYNGERNNCTSVGRDKSFDYCYNLPVKSLSSAFSMSDSCVIIDGGAIKCWGYNQFGQLGNGSGYTSNRGIFSSVPSFVVGIRNAVNVAIGPSHVCTVINNGSVFCWGRNNYGQLGNGSTGLSDSVSGTPLPVIGIRNAVGVSAGSMHSCALINNGSVFCWGNNIYGQLGGSADLLNYPYPIFSGVKNAVKIVSGQYYTCALSANGSVFCWGNNIYGQLGDGTLANNNYPVSVVGIKNAVDIAGGYFHNCAVLVNGSMQCWGYNAYGQLGNGSASFSPLSMSNFPVSVVGISNSAFAAAGYSHSCALLGDNSIKCWGRNNYGQLGDGTFIDRTTPVLVTGVDNVVEIAAGFYHNCIILDDKSVKGWGWNYMGGLGNGSSAQFNVTYPIAVAL